MQSLWSEAGADALVAHYAERGVAEDLALRVYSSRLLGVEPRLVQHGGGNTSLKTTVADGFGEAVAVLCVKGSGWDLGDIEPEGLPAVRMAPLLALRRLNTLIGRGHGRRAQRGRFDQVLGASNPSVEDPAARLDSRALHVDHTHMANAVLAFDRPTGRRGAVPRPLWRAARLAFVPYCMAGFSPAPALPPASSRPTPASRAWCCSSTASSPGATRRGSPMSG